jgi:hypothetical protein
MTNRVFMAALALGAVAFQLMSPPPAAAQSDERNPKANMPSKVSMVYVTDFELAADNIKPASGGILPGPVGQMLRGGPASFKKPEERAHDLVELMAKTMTNALVGDGINAQRLGANDPLPKEGWIVRGVFTKVDEGNRLQRAAIGLGAGQADLTVIVTVQDPKKGAAVPMEEIISGVQSSKMIGAAPMAVVRFNPAMVGAKFVLSGRDMEKNVAQTALKVASKIAEGARKPD